MSAVLEARAIITGEDRTGKAFDSLKARISAMSKQVETMDRAMAVVGPVAKNVEAVTIPAEQAATALARMAEAGKSVGGVASAIASVDRAAATMSVSVGKSSQAIVGLSRELTTAEGKLKAIENFRGASRGLDDAALVFRRGQQEVRRLSAEVATAEHPTKSLQGALAGAEAELARLNAAFKAQGAAVRFTSEALAEAGIPINRLRAEQQQLTASIEQTTAAMKRQALVERSSAQDAAHAARVERELGLSQRRGAGAHQAHGEKHGGLLHNVSEIASLYGTFEAAEIAHSVIETYAHFDKERRYGKVVMGLTDEEQKPLVDQAIVESGKSKFNDIQWLETQRELAARGYNKDQVLGFTPTVASIGAAFDVSIPEAVKGLEGAMLAFRKDTSTLEKAHEQATRTADLQVKASKISGMTFEDVVQLYKYGAAPAQMAHLSEENLLAFGAISKKSNMGGDESGVAFRALAKNLISPTAGAQVAMRAAGIDYNKFQQTPESLDTAGFVDTVAKKYGVALDARATAAIDKVFHDKGVFGNAGKFMPAMREVLGDVLGGDDAKSKGKIANLAGSYRDASMKGVDTNGLMAEVINGISKNPALSNAIFGSKQGGRIYAALGEPDVLNHILDELKNHSQGFAQKVGEDRMAGFDGALAKLENSLKNVDTALGRAFDGGGSGGLLTDATAGLARLTQAFAEAPPAVQQAIGAISALGAAAGLAKTFGLFKGGFGLNATAAALGRAAAHLMEVGGVGWGGKAGRAAGGAATTEGVGTALAIPEIATATAAVLALVGAAAVTELVKKSAEAQEPGKGGQWSAPTLETEPLDRQRLADQEAEANDLRNQIAAEKNRSKLPPGEESPNLLHLRDQLADVENEADLLRTRLGRLHDWPEREVEHGNAYGSLPRPEEFGPKLPPGWAPPPIPGRSVGPVPVPIVSAGSPPLASRPVDLQPLPGSGRSAGPMPAAVVPAAPTPLPSRPVDPQPLPGSGRSAGPVPVTVVSGSPTLSPPRPVDLPPLPGSGRNAGPVPVTIVSGAPGLPHRDDDHGGASGFHGVRTSAEHLGTRAFPAGMHGDFTLGNNSGGFGSPGFGADDHFGPMPRRGPNMSMIDAHPVEPHVDDSALIALDSKLTEVGAHAQTLSATPIAIKADAGSIEALISLLMRAVSLKAQLGSGGASGGTSGSLGPSYPSAAPTGRMGVSR